MKFLGLILCTLGLAAQASEKEFYITIGSDAVSSSQKSLSSVETLKSFDDITVLKVKESEIIALSKMMHDKFHRCGGFIVHDSKEEALSVLDQSLTRRFAKNNAFADYTITEQPRVQAMVNTVDEFGIREVILKLSSFHNRYYKAQTGVDSQAWIKSTWETITKDRSDISVDYFKHSSWPQPSIIMTIEGTTMKDEIVVLGGHADSIGSGWFGKEKARAPGADDNASGIATLTETIRVMVKNGYRPQRTIKFMAYAAEEVGLLGSKAIAKSFKDAGKNVVGVLQLDMTNHKGTEEFDIVFMNDYTNEAQNKFMSKLIDTYVQVPWGYSKCGYGCSDHASWHNQGYPASMPFESTMGDINRKIHSKDDTIDVDRSGGTADHAEKFAKLAVSFLVEMGK